MFLAGLMAFIIRTYLAAKNKKREKQLAAMPKEEMHFTNKFSQNIR